MAKGKRKKLTKNKPPSTQIEPLTLAKYNSISTPTIDLRWLDGMNGCMGSVFKFHRQNLREYERSLVEFQRFIADFSKNQTMDDALRSFGSKKGRAENNGKTKVFLREIFKKLRQNHPELNNLDINYLNDVATHLHLKRGGNGQTIVWGLSDSNTFYILDIDIEHKGI